MKYWAAEYVGKPWVIGERGPDAFDCWGLVHNVYLRHLAVDLPTFAAVDRLDSVNLARTISEGLKDGPTNGWERIDKPAEFVLVAMGAKFLGHVGVYSERDAGNVLHSGRAAGVRFEPLTRIKQQFRRVEFFKLCHT